MTRLVKAFYSKGIYGLTGGYIDNGVKIVYTNLKFIVDLQNISKREKSRLPQLL